MNLVHIHLLLNHWPIIGSFIGLALFLVSLAAHSDDLKQTSLAIFALIALLAIPTYMSGNVAQEVLKGSKGLSEALIQTHQGISGVVKLTILLQKSLFSMVLLIVLSNLIMKERDPFFMIAIGIVVADVNRAVPTSVLRRSGACGGQERYDSGSRHEFEFHFKSPLLPYHATRWPSGVISMLEYRESVSSATP